MEFDESEYNIFWVNSTDYSIGKMNLNTYAVTSFFQGNDTYVPFDLTLASERGSMFVSFSLIMKESITMDEIPTTGEYIERRLLYLKKEADDVDLSSDYIRNELNTICLSNEK